MSHFTPLQTEIYDLDILKKTLNDLKFEFQENRNLSGKQGQMERVDIAIGEIGDYYFGFKRRKEGVTYEIRGPMEYLENKNVKRMVREVLQEYSYQKILHETQKRGFALIQEERLEAGSIKLVLRKVA